MMTTTTFIYSLPQETQEAIKSLIKSSVEGPYLTEEDLENAMCGRVCDLQEMSNYYAVLTAVALADFSPASFPSDLAIIISYAFASADLVFSDDGYIYNEMSEEIVSCSDVMDIFFSHYDIDSWEYDAIATYLDDAFDIIG